MSIRTERIHFVVCDNCEAEHHNPTTRTAMTARIKAAVDGWDFVETPRGQGGKGKANHDACPDCAPTGPSEGAT